MSDTASVLAADDTIVCEDASFVGIQVSSIFVIIFVSIGMPIMFIFVLSKAMGDYQRDTRQLQGARLAELAQEMGVQEDVAEYVVRGAVLGQQYSFLMNACESSVAHALRSNATSPLSLSCHVASLAYHHRQY